MLLKFFILVIICNNTFVALSQRFLKGEQFIVPAAQILIENYSPVILGPEIINDGKANQFTADQTDTQLQVLIDSDGNRYHILSQTNFSGKIIYLALSNNLSQLFNKRERPAFVFNQCIKQLNSSFSPQQNEEAAVRCIMDRLEFCSTD